jgi:signal transduction histidine kinase
MIQVADTGLGISNEKQDKIFEPYYGLKTDDQPHRGMGLGLSLTKMLVNLHGGNISIDSTEGHGSTFKVTLPYQRNP